MTPVAALLTGAASLASPVAALPCAPPVGVPLSLIYRQSLWRGDGAQTEVTVRRSLLFRQDGNGFVAEVTLRSIAVSPADAGSERRLAAAFGPAGGPPLKVRFDATLRLTALDDLDAVWLRFLARQRDLRRQQPSNPRSDRMHAILAAMAPAARVEMLAGFLQPLLRYCGAPLPRDAVSGADGAVLVTDVTDRPGQRAVAQFLLDSTTGLARRIDRTSTPADQPLRPMKEQWTIAPE